MLDRSSMTHSAIVATEIQIPHGSTVYLLGEDGARSPQELRDDLLVLGFPHDEGGWVYESRGARYYWPSQEARS